MMPQNTSLFGQTSQTPLFNQASPFGQTSQMTPQNTSLFGQTSQTPLFNQTSPFGQTSQMTPQNTSMFYGQSSAPQNMTPFAQTSQVQGNASPFAQTSQSMTPAYGNASPFAQTSQLQGNMTPFAQTSQTSNMGPAATSSSIFGTQYGFADGSSRTSAPSVFDQRTPYAGRMTEMESTGLSPRGQVPSLFQRTDIQDVQTPPGWSPRSQNKLPVMSPRRMAKSRDDELLEILDRMEKARNELEEAKIKMDSVQAEYDRLMREMSASPANERSETTSLIEQQNREYEEALLMDRSKKTQQAGDINGSPKAGGLAGLIAPLTSLATPVLTPLAGVTSSTGMAGGFSGKSPAPGQMSPRLMTPPSDGKIEMRFRFPDGRIFPQDNSVAAASPSETIAGLEKYASKKYGGEVRVSLIGGRPVVGTDRTKTLGELAIPGKVLIVFADV